MGRGNSTAGANANGKVGVVVNGDGNIKWKMEIVMRRQMKMQIYKMEKK